MFYLLKGGINLITKKIPYVGASDQTVPMFTLDSLGLVNLIVAVELHAEEDLGVTISLADQKAMSQVGNVFQSVRSLVDYIISLLGAETNGTE